MTNFDPLRGPPAVAQGTEGRVTVGGLTVGTLTAWRVVNSPTTNKPTLIAEGTFHRYYTQAIGLIARAELTPSARPYRIGRPRPSTPFPMALTGKLFELTAARITISEGEIEARD